MRNIKYKLLKNPRTIKHFSGQLSNVLRKCLVFCLIVLFSNPLSLFVLGVLNRVLFRPIQSIFICYPASPKYTKKYFFRFLIPFTKYCPVIVGFFIQSRRIGIICGISAIEEDFERQTYLNILHKYSFYYSNILGVKTVNYSGILPTVLRRTNLITPEDLRQRSKLVGDVLVKSERKISEQHNLKSVVPIILLGGKGSVGKATHNCFNSLNRNIIVVDKGDKFPKELTGKEVVLIDVARKGVLETYIDEFWTGMIVINETYPEPKEEVIKKLRELQIPIYHIVGVKAQAYPSFPHAYHGGIPCCAMNPSPNFEVLVKRL